VRIISLKWKALWGLSLVLFAIIAALTWLSYSKLQDQFAAARAAEEAVYVREIHALLHQMDARLQQLAGWLPALEGMRDALEAEDPQALEMLFEGHWPGAQLDYDLQSASFFSRTGELIGRWDDGSAPPAVPPEWVARVAEEERPSFALTCTDRCYQVGVLPLLAEGRTVGTLALTSSVVELIVRFREVAGRDIGVLIPPIGESEAPRDLSPLLEPWGLRVAALSDAPRRLPLLRRVALSHPSLPLAEGQLEFQEEEHHYVVKLFPMRDFTPYSDGFFLVLSDITEEVQRIDVSAWRSLSAGLTGMLVSEVVLFVILSASLTRLQRTAQVLPLLAHNGFDEVRQRLARHTRRRGLQDEIDYLDATAVDLALQLEALSAKVQERTEALKLRMRDLDRERSFVSSLLDTAQVIILTQDRAGRIGLANHYSLKVTGFELPDLVGRRFRDLLNPVDAHICANDLARLVQRQIRQYSHEAELVCATGRRLQLAWFHSALDAVSEGGAVVLSAGLDITERKHAERRIAWLADHDPLTGLVNRRRFEDVLQRGLRASLESSASGGALMYIDLDQFKLINDTLGHSAGDRVLESFAGNLARLGDTIASGGKALAARLGGDEFAVVLENVDRQGALAAAERLRDGLNRLEYNTGSEVFRITSSIGVALYPEHGLGFQELMQNADLAMYQAKALGEGRAQLFSGDEAVRTRMVQRLRGKERIDEALYHDRLVMYFQPIVHLVSGATTHYEALVRMLTADGELVPPADFIPVAEATGQITAVDCRVLELVFDSWRRLHRSGRTVGMHINLSARAFQTSEWWSTLNHLLETCEADPSGLVFEITETAAVADLKDARALMEAVRDKGCRFALDDFGVGFSSFNYVKELPVDLVKIDGAFITRLAERRDSQLVVKALVDVANGFGKRTVAEFVDSAHTLERLRELKVDYAQGFHVGKPIPEVELMEETATFGMWGVGS
jgi:diguanylate cyclase (GGDEF)-like protein/PAS domain S-box-containing protein